MTFFTVLIIIFIGWQLAKLFVRFAMPRLIMWMFKRRFEKATGYKANGSQGRRSGFKGRSNQQQSRRPRRRGKIIPNDVGEYVEFEEISTYQSTTTTDSKTHIKYKEEEQISDAEWTDL